MMIQKSCEIKKKGYFYWYRNKNLKVISGYRFQIQKIYKQEASFKRHALLFVILFLQSAYMPDSLMAQININQAQISLHNVVIAIHGNLEGATSIQGNGKIIFSGNDTQLLHINGNDLPDIEINNSNGVQLLSDAGIMGNLLFANGKVFTGDFELKLSAETAIIGYSDDKFIVTGNNGKVRKNISTALTNYEIPVGYAGGHFPVSISSTGSFNNAFVTVRCRQNIHPSKHPRSTDYISQYWSFTQSGITGTLSAVGKYGGPGNIIGQENQLAGLFFNGSNWQDEGSIINTSTHTAGSNIQGNGDLYAMNKFILVRVKAFLQGAYQNSDGRMADRLRNPGTYQPGTMPVANLLPLEDPYRSSIYQQQFTHINNADIETVAPSVLYDQADAARNMVDWVFLELRTGAGGIPGSQVLQTRSALLRRDGLITDIDGLSPVYFKGAISGNNYTLAIRHRNHLAMSTNPATYPQNYSLSSQTAVTDFTGMSETQVFGPASACKVTNGINLLWAGNTNADHQVRYNGPANDRDFLLAEVLQGATGAVLTDLYSRGDFNMDRIVRYNGPGNDRDFLLASPLEANQGTIRNEYLPGN